MRARNPRPKQGVTRITQDGLKGQDPYEVLAERLTAILMGSASTQDDNPNHAPAGNPDGGQFTSGPGGGGASEATEKPTAAKAKTAKGKLHELLSSGHGFTKAELMKIAGIESGASLSSWLSMFKNQKHAGAYGALDIKKMPNGVYQVVKANGELAGPNPNFKPASPLPAPEPEAKPGKVTKAEADKTYAIKQEASLKKLANDIASGGSPSMSVLDYKTSKAKAMTEWVNSLQNTTKIPAKQNLFNADAKLGLDVKAIVDSKPGLNQLQDQMAKAIDTWKINTQLEKQGKFGVPAAPPAPKLHADKGIQQIMKDFVSSGPAKQLSYDSLKPKDFVPISAADFTKTGAFTKGMQNLKNTLAKSGTGGAVQNKQLVAKRIGEKLKNSQAFQHLDQLVQEVNKTSVGAVPRLISSWASSSGDGNKLSCALQLAVQRAFNLPEEHLEKKALHGLSSSTDGSVHSMASAALGLNLQSNEELGAFKNALQDFIIAQYETTQEVLKENGLDHVYVARGMHGVGKDSHEGSEAVNLKLQPASSFSANIETARAFSGSGGAVFLTKVPASQVLGTYVSGFGCTGEHEVVVIGHESTPSFGIPPTKAKSLTDVNLAMKNKLEGVI